MAKVVVVGTSNSVMGEKGYIRSLSLEHDVINLSTGRVPFYFHIVTIEKNKKLIEKSDLLIIDHYINDISIYATKLGAKYERDFEDFYRFLSTINTNILNLLFPIQNLPKKSSFNWYKKVKKFSALYDISILDLNEYDFKDRHYIDPIHIEYQVSYLLGLSLSKIIGKFEETKPDRGFIKKNPFKIIDLTDPVDFQNNNKRKVFENSLMRLDYVDIIEELRIIGVGKMQLKSLGYLVPKDSKNHSGVVVNNQTYSLDPGNGGYFHEAFCHELKIVEDITIYPLRGEYSDIWDMMSRHKMSGIFDFLYITELLLYLAMEMKYQSSIRKKVDTSLIDLNTMLRDWTIQPVKLEPEIVELLKESAILFENKDLKKAHALMSLAHSAQPLELMIKKKLKQYSKKLQN